MNIKLKFTVLRLPCMFGLLLLFLLNGFWGRGQGLSSYEYIVPESQATVVNHRMLEMFDFFKSRGSVSDSIRMELIGNPDHRNLYGWLRVFEAYKNAIHYQGEQIQSRLDSVLADSFRLDSLVRIPADEPMFLESIVNGLGADNFQLATEFVSGKIQPELKSTGMVFHVQIAASKKKLEDNYLLRKYQGSLPINHFQEDSWEKYYVGSFDNSKDARKALNESKVEGAFIISYLNGKKMLYYKALQLEKTNAESLQQLLSDVSNDHFRVQIAASHRPMSHEELRRIYPNIDHIAMIFEEGWFKYSVEAGADLRGAWMLAYQTQIQGAFVVRYRHGQRISLR